MVDSQEYLNRIEKIVENAKKLAVDNPKKAQQQAHEALKRMGLLDEKSQAKRNIVTVSHSLLSSSHED